MTTPDRPRLTDEREWSALRALRESGNELESASPSLDKDSAAAQLRKAGKDFGFLASASHSDLGDDLASAGGELEETSPPFDSEASADAIRSAAHTLGLLEAHDDWQHRPTAVFGIDLGTSNSSIAYINDAGEPTLIKSALGELATPSVVYFESTSLAVVGQAAKNHALLAPDLVAQRVKLAMGTSIGYTFHGNRHTPETISALILRELARAAEEKTGQVVRDVVVTVPAYFGVADREATRRAGYLAGLNVLDLLPEPVAAVLQSYATTGPVKGTRHVLVYDLGGTFNTAVIRLDGDDISVVCTDGDPGLGGMAWDEAIADYLLGQVTAAHPALRPRDDPAFIQDLMITAERLKQELSVVESRRVTLRIGGTVTLVELTRGMMEELTAGLLDRTISATRRMIELVRYKGVTQFDDVLLVGGMTRMPVVTRVLKDRLGLMTRHHEPDLAVAKGAAIFALVRSVHPVGAPTEPARTPELVAASTGVPVAQVVEIARKRVSTVVSRGFGVMSLDGRDPLALTDPVRARRIVVHLLPAGTPLPADTGPFTFHTAIDNQRMVAIEVWEQAGTVESEELADNRKIGQGILKGIPARLPAQTPIEVTFYMSETGLLTIRAIEPGSGTQLRFELEIGNLIGQEMRKARTSVARYRIRALSA